MDEAKKKFIGYIEKVNRRIIFIALTIAVTVAYFFNPLDNVELTKWNRTFCTAIFSGISIDIRIGNFYKLFFLYIPLTVILLMLVLTLIFEYRPSYADFYMKISILLSFSTLASYISRYTSGSTEINTNPMLQCILGFLLVLSIIALLDKKEQFDFQDITLFFMTFMISATSCCLLFHGDHPIIYMIIGVGLVILSAIMVSAPFSAQFYPNCRNVLLVLLWLPAVIRTALEGIYFLTERGRGIERYYTHIGRASIIFVVLVVLFIWLIRKRNMKLEVFGYIGSIVSLTMIGYFPASYQYTYSYSSFSHIYELGNNAVAMDSYLYGKLPIIDYFSAHALGDVWTRLLYCFIHDDIKGILVNPYEGVTNIIAFIIAFYIAKELFDENIAVLYVILFPGTIVGIKWTSVCCISIAMLLYICKRPGIKAYILFWICALISAFITYDEGISLGIACILAYMIFSLLQREWEALRRFIFCGSSVGVAALLLYAIYAVVTGIPIVGRLKEWISVSVGSSSTWATADFGDQTSFAFLVSYFIVPMTAVILLMLVFIRYIRSKRNIVLTVIIAAFAFAELLYITRTIVYHNLAVCSGTTGVLLNFIHWTVSLYVLCTVSEKEKSENTKLVAWAGTMMAVILIEGTAVTHCWPSADSALLSKGLNAAKSWDLQDGVTANKGEPRIILDKESTVMVSQFKNVFDTLLTDDQTFLDFANVTSLYLLTARIRPCYVGQSPSLLTNLYSQECFLEEISEYDCPLAIMGTTGENWLQQMVGIPHNVRYYKIAEYIYRHYRPLVTFGEVAIWCEKDSYEIFRNKLILSGFEDADYTIVDYGYDFTTSYIDDNGKEQVSYKPYHSYDLKMVPYVWANYDDYQASCNDVLVEISASETNRYVFAGSQTCVADNGNYLAFEMKNTSEDNITTNVIFYDSSNEGAKIQYYFTVVPGTNQYVIRISEDYFWDVFNIDTILFGSNEAIETENVIRILEGD